MNALTTPTLEADLHRLELRFAPLRIQRPQALERLSGSIERSGQLVPVIAVVEAEQRWVLIDGYRRVQALSRCAQDTAWVELWDCDVAQALLRALASQVRPWEPLEEAALMRELITRYGRSQRDIARHSGRDASWVSRRLVLIEALPEAALAAVCRGELSTWAATRVLAPLARANTDHAQALLDALRQAPLSTRELDLWYRHYQQANRSTRERLVLQPQLFLKARRAREARAAGPRPARGPRGGLAPGPAADRPTLPAALPSGPPAVRSRPAPSRPPPPVCRLCPRQGALGWLGSEPQPALSRWSRQRFARRS